jgi:hypothetical protein
LPLVSNAVVRLLMSTADPIVMANRGDPGFPRIDVASSFGLGNQFRSSWTGGR